MTRPLSVAASPRQLTIRTALVGDAIDAVLIPGPPRTGIRRLYLLDLLIGYGLRSEMHRGWWCQRALRLHGPRRTFADMRPGPPDDEPSRFRDAGWRRLWQVHPSVGPKGFDGWHDHWKCEVRAEFRRHAVQVSWHQIRPRLEEETGYREIWTHDNAIDAARVYSSKPKSLAYRTLMTLIDNPTVWTKVKHAA